MSTERVEFEQSADGLFKGALQAHEDPELVEKLRAAGLDLTRKLAPAYPAADFYRWLKIAAVHRYKDLSEADAVRAVGKLAVDRGMNSTMLGKAVLKAMQLLGIRRSLMRIGATFKHGNNYIDAKVKELAPTSLEIQLGPLVGPPEYFAGVLEQGPRLMGAQHVSVTQTRTDGEHITWRIDWSEDRF